MFSFSPSTVTFAGISTACFRYHVPTSASYASMEEISKLGPIEYSYNRASSLSGGTCQLFLVLIMSDLQGNVCGHACEKRGEELLPFNGDMLSYGELDNFEWLSMIKRIGVNTT